LHNFPSVILVFIFVNVKTLIMLMLLLEHTRGRLGPCGRPDPRGHHIGDPWSKQ